MKFSFFFISLKFNILCITLWKIVFRTIFLRNVEILKLLIELKISQNCFGTGVWFLEDCKIEKYFINGMKRVEKGLFNTITSLPKKIGNNECRSDDDNLD